MTEDQAKAWLSAHPEISAHNLAQLERFVDILVTENTRQNLIAPASVEHVWARHIADSAQLVSARADGLWIDIGSGAGLPGLVIAILRSAPMLLVEPRRKRAEFLAEAAKMLGLDHVWVEQRDIRKVEAKAAVISARAVASTPDIFAMAEHLCDASTQWVLPKGRNAMNELESARLTWQGMFHVEPSVTEDGSKIIYATGIARRQP